jgi:hypothetical protein
VSDTEAALGWIADLLDSESIPRLVVGRRAARLRSNATVADIDLYIPAAALTHVAEKTLARAAQFSKEVHDPWLGVYARTYGSDTAQHHPG